jgi:hypothetical protein
MKHRLKMKIWDEYNTPIVSIKGSSIEDLRKAIAKTLKKFR